MHRDRALCPDVVVMEYAMPRLNGLEGTRAGTAEGLIRLERQRDHKGGTWLCMGFDPRRATVLRHSAMGNGQVAVLLTMVVTIALAAGVMQLIRGEETHLHLMALPALFLWLTMPPLVLVAALAGVAFARTDATPGTGCARAGRGNRRAVTLRPRGRKRVLLSRSPAGARRFPFVSVLRAELRLALRGQPWWGYLCALGWAGDVIWPLDEIVGALQIRDILDLPCRIARHHRTGRYVVSHDRAHAHQGMLADGDVWQQRGVGPDLGTPLDRRSSHALLCLGAQRMQGVGQDDVWPDPAAVLQYRVLGYEGLRMDPHAVSDAHVVLDDGV